MNEQPTARPERMLTFASGGWVLLLTGVATIALAVWALAPVFLRISNRPPGDGHDLASYLFALDPVEGVELGTLVPAHGHRDLLEALDDPASIPGSAVLRFGEGARGKYLVPSDRVIGVEIDGSARAYPLLVLNNHEIVNDTLGGEPIVVTYSPLCDSALVFHRTGSDGVERRFGVSGLLLSSNLVMYDRRLGDDGAAHVGGEWLWSQLRGTSITADEIGHPPIALPRIACELVTWEDWFERHPGTTVVAPDQDMIKRYRETNYASYFMTDRIAYPLARELPAGEKPKERWIVVEGAQDPKAYALSDLTERADEDGEWHDGDLVFTVRPAGLRGMTVRVQRGDGGPVIATHGLRFALHAFDLPEG